MDDFGVKLFALFVLGVLGIVYMVILGRNDR